jgi:hypothetical protein
MDRNRHSRLGRDYIRKSDLQRDLDRVLFALESGKGLLFRTSDDLRTVNTDEYERPALSAFVQASSLFYRWYPSSILPDDGLNVIRPSIGPSATGPGRWLKDTGGGGGGDATSIQTIPVDPLPPVLNNVLYFNGFEWIPIQLTMDMIAPAFNISSFSAATAIVEVGETMAMPLFTASYTAVPDTSPGSVILTDDYGTPSKDITLTPTNFTSNGTFIQSSYGETVQFTLTARKGTVTRVGGLTMSWLQQVYWGIGVAGGSTEGFIKALSGHALTNSRSRTFSVTAGVGQKIYYAHRVAYGIVTFYVGGFEGGFIDPIIISVTNDHGFAENYYLYESVNPNLGMTTVTAV